MSERYRGIRSVSFGSEEVHREFRTVLDRIGRKDRVKEGSKRVVWGLRSLLTTRSGTRWNVRRRDTSGVQEITLTDFSGPH